MDDCGHLRLGLTGQCRDLLLAEPELLEQPVDPCDVARRQRRPHLRPVPLLRLDVVPLVANGVHSHLPSAVGRPIRTLAPPTDIPPALSEMRTTPAYTHDVGTVIREPDPGPDRLAVPRRSPAAGRGLPGRSVSTCPQPVTSSPYSVGPRLAGRAPAGCRRSA